MKKSKSLFLYRLLEVDGTNCLPIVIRKETDDCIRKSTMCTIVSQNKIINNYAKKYLPDAA